MWSTGINCGQFKERVNSLDDISLLNELPRTVTEDMDIWENGRVQTKSCKRIYSIEDVFGGTLWDG